MAPSSSSTKKAAKLTQRGKGRKVRFQGGTLFPFVVAAVLVLGLGTIVYARQSQPKADASPPTVNDHWHAAYGFYLCGEWFQLAGNLEQQGTPGFQDYVRTGVHSHDDGVIHWHPFTAAAVGTRAKLGVFIEGYQVDLSNDELSFPDGQPVPAEGTTGTPLAEYIEGETQCNGDDAELSVVVWDSYTDTGDGTQYIADFGDIRVDRNSMVFSIAFAARDADIPMPPWASQLPELGAVDVDQGETPPTGSAPSTVAGATVPGASSVPATGATTPAGDGTTVPTGSTAATIPTTVPTSTSAPPG